MPIINSLVKHLAIVSINTRKHVFSYRRCTRIEHLQNRSCRTSNNKWNEWNRYISGKSTYTFRVPGPMFPVVYLPRRVQWVCIPATPASRLCSNLLERYLWNFAYLLFLILRLAPETKSEQTIYVIMYYSIAYLIISYELGKSVREHCYFTKGLKTKWVYGSFRQHRQRIYIPIFDFQ